MSIFSKLFRHAFPVDLSGFTDFHSHILPGVDDGVGALSESLEILSRYEQIGIQNVWLTPHIMEDMPNSTELLKERFDELQSNYHGSIMLHLASENMLDALFYERLKNRDLLPIGEKSDMLLIETSYFNAPLNLNDIFQKIKNAGFHPLLAHPERYTYVNKISQYRDWKDAGVKFQLNILSLSGHYGIPAQKKAKELLNRGMYDFAGTDLHRMAQVGSMQSLRLPRILGSNLCQLIKNNV